MIFYVAGAVLAVLFLTKGGSGVSYKNNFDELFKKYGSQFGVDWRVLKAIAIIESSLGEHPRVKAGLKNPADTEGSKSEDGKSWGLMQVTIPTAKDYDPLATAQKLNDPEYSVKIAAEHLKKLQSIFLKDDPRWLEYVVKSYNQGQGNTKKGKTFADGYWVKFKNAYSSIN